MIDISVGVELTLIPKRRGLYQEFRRERDAIATATHLNGILDATVNTKAHKESWGSATGAPLRAKSDWFRAKWSDQPQPHSAWCVEVGCAPFNVSALDYDDSYTTKVFKGFYEAAAICDLHPHISKVGKRKGKKVILDFASAGGHLHCAIDFWSEGWDFLLKLYLLEKRLCADFVNYPFIRWVFAQWSDNLNSGMALSRVEIKELDRLIRKGDHTATSLTNVSHDKALTCHSIKQRFAYTGKPHYPTYEFRFFDMPRNVKELALQTRFLRYWIGSHVQAIDKAIDGVGGTRTADGLVKIWNDTPGYAMNGRYLKRLTSDMRFARASVEGFWNRIGLDFNAGWGECFWERGMLCRFKNGQFL